MENRKFKSVIVDSFTGGDTGTLNTFFDSGWQYLSSTPFRTGGDSSSHGKILVILFKES